MPRLTLPFPDAMDAEQRKVYDRIVSGPRGRVQGPLLAALHSPELADRWQALGALLRYGTTLPPRLSELAILVTGRACNSPFEWHAHSVEARKLGLDDSIIEALLAQTQPPGLSAEETVVWRYSVELNQHKSVSDATYAAAVACLSERTVVELTALVGYYTLVAMALNCHEIALPDGEAPAFPLPQHRWLR